MDPARFESMAAEQKRELLAEIVSGKPGLLPKCGNNKRIVSDPASRFQPFPLTEVQRAYWLGRGPAFGLGNVSCHAYYEIDVVGLDLPFFFSCWRLLIDRHDMLRAVIQNGEQ